MARRIKLQNYSRQAFFTSLLLEVWLESLKVQRTEHAFKSHFWFSLLKGPQFSLFFRHLFWWLVHVQRWQKTKSCAEFQCLCLSTYMVKLYGWVFLNTCNLFLPQVLTMYIISSSILPRYFNYQFQIFKDSTIYFNFFLCFITL